MITTDNLVSWLKNLSSNLKIKEIAKGQLSKKAIDLYYDLSKQGMFPELLMTKRYQSGLLYIARVR